MAEEISDKKIREILRGYPAAISLFDEVRELYGGYLTIEPREQGKPSQAAVDPKPNGAFQAYLRIAETPTRLPAAAVTHELLHLNRWRVGFPFKYGLTEKDGWLAEKWNVGVEETLNAIEHLSFFDQFIQIGLPADSFLAYAAPLDIEFDRQRMQKCRQYRSLDVCKSFCAVQYFVFSTNLCNADPAKMQDYAQMAMSLGLLTVGEIQAMHDWIAQGDFQNRQNYATSVSQFLSLLHLPLVYFHRLVRQFGRLVHLPC